MVSCYKRKNGCISILLFLGKNDEIQDLFDKKLNPDTMDGDTNTTEKETDDKDDTRLLYPPEDSKVIKRMIDYLKTKKNTSTECQATKMLPQEYLLPSEKICLECSELLPSATIVSKHAKIITMDYKVTKCDTCGMLYRYQEKHNGIQNYNYTFLLALTSASFFEMDLISEIQKLIYARFHEYFIFFCF